MVEKGELGDRNFSFDLPDLPASAAVQLPEYTSRKASAAVQLPENIAVGAGLPPKLQRVFCCC
jgi:hypothetical protein